MKKLIAMVLVLTLVLSMGALAFAVEYENMDTIIIGKVIEKNDFATSPAEIFEFTISKERVSKTEAEQPDLTVDDITLAENVTNGSFGIDLKDKFTSTGVYTYHLKETAGNTAGMVYDGRTLVLTVYVLSDGEGGLIKYATLHDVTSNDKMNKETGFVNKFNAGKLEIYKEVTGNMGDQSLKFDITVELTLPNEIDINEVSIFVDGVKEELTFVGGKATINREIEHDQTINITNIPYGVSWVVGEEDYSSEGYVTNISSEEGTIGVEEDNIEITITNNKQSLIDTGINLDNLPYVLILVGAAAGLVAFTMKRRPTRDE